ncbi:hypothetical protein, variant 4 [Exophiala mesophila]|uniref:Methyltransferase domain-containing protein n=1 Tax=Exophiala mesophila TaxID=212818 RepID=A0A0D1Z816_EXOME|nr:hypothetical protein, variant 4 [Exophiala mesophila]KIV90154.1 hypothetical protein, variant 4 [Exophiala mesophila]
MPADPGPIDRYNRKVLYLDREFQEYSLQHEIYLAPIDLDEETRLRDQHEMLKMIYQDWNNSLYPRVVGDPEKILELGFGSGEWAFELAEYDPDCTVLGVDICSLMAVDQLDNMDYQIANLNEPFEFDEPGSFDLVHSRFVASGIAATRWPNFVRDIHRMLQPRGWAVLTEWDVVFRSDHSIERLGALQEWTRLYHQSIARSSRPQGRKSMRVAQDCETWMRMAGFVNVTTDIRDVPTCAWRTGRISHTNCHLGATYGLG